MEELFPSEIARLVLGYLKESKCEKSWNVFLEESSNLHEYCELYKRGKCYPTNVNGKSLIDILNEYCILKKDPENNCSNELSASTFKEKCKIILEDIVTNAAEHVILKYFPPISDNHHKDNTSEKTKVVRSPQLMDSNCIDYENTVEKSRENACSDHAPEINSHNIDSCMEVNVTDNNASQPCEKSGSGANVTSHNLSVIESSTSGSIYLQEIIKVEKDDSFSIFENSPEKNICDIGCHATKQNELSNSFSECPNDLNYSKNMENLSEADAVSGNSKNTDKMIVSKQTTDSMELQIVKTVKLEPFSGSNSNEPNTNCFQNSSIIASQDSSTVEISQTALCDTQSTIGQFSNLVNNISFSTNQSGYALQTTPFSNQPVAVNDLSFSSVPTYIMPNYSSSTPFMQNNAQYSFVINTPAPWKESTVGGFSLNLPTIQPNNIGPILASVDSVGSNRTTALTAVEPVSSSTPSVTGVTINASPALTTASGQPQIISSVPSKVSSCVNTDLVTSGNGKVMDKHSSNQTSKRTRNKSELLKEKEGKNAELRSQCQLIQPKSKKKILPLYRSSETGKKTDNNAKPQSRQVKTKTRRKGK